MGQGRGRKGGGGGNLPGGTSLSIVHSSPTYFRFVQRMGGCCDPEARTYGAEGVAPPPPPPVAVAPL